MRGDATMEAKITGTTLPVLELALTAGDKIIAETGQLSWMTAGIELNTTHATAGTSSCPVAAFS
jgi:uncharacterized protein (AIM24 family)